MASSGGFLSIPAVSNLKGCWLLPPTEVSTSGRGCPRKDVGTGPEISAGPLYDPRQPTPAHISLHDGVTHGVSYEDRQRTDLRDSGIDIAHEVVKPAAVQ